MMNSRRVFMSQPRAPDPQFMNFIRTRFCSPQPSFPPALHQQNNQYPYLRQIQPYTQRSEYGYHGMSGTDGGHVQQQPNGVFWDKFRDIRKRAQQFSDSEVETKNMRRIGVATNDQNSQKDPADDYQSRPKWKKTHFGRMSANRDGHLFSVCSYNILAQNLLEMHPDLYAHCYTEYLDWEYRKRNLLNELKKSAADIMCLQEVQEEHFLHIFKPEFRNLGFSSVFKKRTGDKQDGCAIFYRDQSFQLETCRSVEYYHPHVKLLDRDNIGLIVILKSKQVSGRLCVANTHLLFNPKRGDVKLAQLSKLFAEIDKVAYETNGSGGKHCPVIVCGDFNSQPKSPFFNFIENSFLDYSGMMSGEVCKPSAEDTSPWKRGSQLYVPLLPRNVGISESCQYLNVIEQRRALLRKSAEGKEKLEDEDRKNKNESKAEKQLSPPVSTTECRKMMAGASSITTRDEVTKDGGARKDKSCDSSSTDPGQTLEDATSSSTDGVFSNVPGQTSVGATSSSIDKVPLKGSGKNYEGATSSSADGMPSKTPEETLLGATSSNANGMPSKAPEETLLGATSSSAYGVVQGLSMGPRRTSASADWPTPGPSKPSQHTPTGRLHHNLNIESAYQVHDGFVTTHHTKTNCVVDFMFNSRPRNDTKFWDLKRVAWLPLFTNEDADIMGGLPNKHWSSDHYRLQVKFMLRPPNDTKDKKK